MNPALPLTLYNTKERSSCSCTLLSILIDLSTGSMTQRRAAHVTAARYYLVGPCAGLTEVSALKKGMMMLHANWQWGSPPPLESHCH